MRNPEKFEPKRPEEELKEDIVEKKPKQKKTEKEEKGGGEGFDYEKDKEKNILIHLEENANEQYVLRKILQVCYNNLPDEDKFLKTLGKEISDNKLFSLDMNVSRTDSKSVPIARLNTPLGSKHDDVEVFRVDEKCFKIDAPLFKEENGKSVLILEKIKEKLRERPWTKEKIIIEQNLKELEEGLNHRLDSLKKDALSKNLSEKSLSKAKLEIRESCRVAENMYGNYTKTFVQKGSMPMDKEYEIKMNKFEEGYNNAVQKIEDKLTGKDEEHREATKSFIEGLEKKSNEFENKIEKDSEQTEEEKEKLIQTVKRMSENIKDIYVTGSMALRILLDKEEKKVPGGDININYKTTEKRFKQIKNALIYGKKDKKDKDLNLKSKKFKNYEIETGPNNSIIFKDTTSGISVLLSSEKKKGEPERKPKTETIEHQGQKIFLLTPEELIGQKFSESWDRLDDWDYYKKHVAEFYLNAGIINKDKMDDLVIDQEKTYGHHFVDKDSARYKWTEAFWFWENKLNNIGEEEHYKEMKAERERERENKKKEK